MQNKGFTLLELLVTLGIVAIFLSLAVPNVSFLLNKYRLHGAAHDLLNDVQLARSEAVKRGVRVTLNNHDGNWDTGWSTFIDADEDGTFDTGETVLAERPAYTSNLTISGNSPVASMISYISTGETRTASGGFQAGSVSFCASGFDQAKKLVISSIGRARLESMTAAGNC